MSIAAAFPSGDARRPALGIDAALQQIASVAHLRGVRRPERAAQVDAIIRGTAARRNRGSPAEISRSMLAILTGYARKSA